MRLFVAISVPENLYEQCAHLQSQFSDLKKTKDFHLTLQFLGGKIENSQPIIDALSTIQFNPFEVEMNEVAPFPNIFDPQGVWIECDPSAVLLNLAQDIQESMGELGYFPDHPFRAHITLGRYKKEPIKKPQSINIEPIRFKVDQFHLMESVPKEEGHTYKSLKSFKS